MLANWKENQTCKRLKKKRAAAGRSEPGMEWVWLGIQSYSHAMVLTFSTAPLVFQSSRYDHLSPLF